MAEIELGQVAVQMLLGAMLIGAAHAALEHRKVILNGVRVNDVAAFISDVFPSRVLGSAVIGEDPTHAPIEAAFVGVESAFAGNVFSHERSDINLVSLDDMEGTNRTAAFDQAKDSALVAGPRLALQKRQTLARWRRRLVGRLTIVRFVGFHDLTVAAKRAKVAFTHRFANAVRDKPCGFQGHAKGAVKLVARDAFLGRRHKKDRLQPMVQLHMAGFKDGADFDGEGLAALVALVSANAGALALHLGNALDTAAMRANRTVRPNPGFHKPIGGGFIVKVAVGQDGHG